jgi:hypothetical protein
MLPHQAAPLVEVGPAAQSAGPIGIDNSQGISSRFEVIEERGPLVKCWKEPLKIGKEPHGPKGRSPLVEETFQQFDRMRERLRGLIQIVDTSDRGGVLAAALRLHREAAEAVEEEGGMGPLRPVKGPRASL